MRGKQILRLIIALFAISQEIPFMIRIYELLNLKLRLLFSVCCGKTYLSFKCRAYVLGKLLIKQLRNSNTNLRINTAFESDQWTDI